MTRRPRTTNGCKSLFRRWEDKVSPEPNSGCWIWVGAAKAHGYGHIYDGCGKFKLAHRLSYEFFKGPIPEGHVVMHICDNPWCVNPDHLRAGTAQENVQDCLRKGRVDRSQAKRKRKVVWNGLTVHQIAEIAGVSVSTIRGRLKIGIRDERLCWSKRKLLSSRTPSGLNRDVSHRARDAEGRFV